MITILRNCDDAESKIPKLKLSNYEDSGGQIQRANATAQSKLATKSKGGGGNVLEISATK